MGTRADFYVGRGPGAEWLGSIAWDGGWIAKDGKPGAQLLKARTEDGFRKRLAVFFATRDDATLPEQGWPWPWDTSDITDCAYAFDGGRVWMTWGRFWYEHLVKLDAEGEVKPEARDATPVEWPDMSARRAVTYGKRSGLMVFSTP